MNQILKAVFFDLDGTLLDTAPDFEVVVNTLRARYDLPPLPFEQIRATVSHGARALVTLALSLQDGDDLFEARKQELLDLYRDNLSQHSTLFPGLGELIEWLEQNQLHWGIVTNKPRAYTDPILSRLALQQRCASVVCPDDVSQAKPHPEPLLLACLQTGCKPAEAIYIGDHRRDIESGRNAGMRTIAAHYGYVDPTDPAHQWQAHFNVNDSTELQPLLASLLH